MTPLTAGERLSQTSGEAPGRGGPVRPRDPGRTPPPRRPPPRGPLRWVRRLFGLLLAMAMIVGIGGALAGYAAYLHYNAGLPDLAGLKNYQPKVMSRIYAGDSRLMAELATERRIFVPYTAIPDLVKHAFLAAEDQNFFNHGAIDPLAIARAGFTDLLQYGRGRRPLGASTITQQVAKNMLIGNEMSLSRKIREALLAVRIEQTLSKDRILELYLNEIYLGLQSYGVAAAAESYFNKSLSELTPAEAAFLGGLPKAPNNYNPFRFPDAARARRDYVLDRMLDNRFITAAEQATAKVQPVLPTAFRRPDVVAGADYFSEEVRRQLIDKFGADQTTQGGLVVRTSLDTTLQGVAEKVLHAGLVRYDQRRGGWRGPVSHVAVGAGPRTDWADALGAVARPPGMPAGWQLAVVTAITGGSATMGVLDRATQGSPATSHVLPMLLSDLGWARANHAGNLGPAPRRIEDVVQVGDVVMTELAGTEAPPAVKGARSKLPAPRTPRLLLRQIPQVQGALVSLDPATGRVFAMAGGWSYEMSQFNRATQAQRQPGSSFKPIVYLTAMEQNISPSQRFLDAPFVLNTSAGEWRPGNYEMDFNGPTPLHVALEKSLNLVTVRVAERVGMDAVAANAIAMHEVDQMPHVLPAALGAVDTTVLREAGAYAAFANGGHEVVPTLIDTVQDRDGHVIMASPGIACSGCNDPSHPPSILDQRHQIADPQSAFQVVMMMEGVVLHGTGTTAVTGINRQIAGKTGTSQDFNDAWFAGFTPDLVTVVWVGFDTPSSLGKDETGAAVAAPVWHDFMAAALQARPDLKFVPPAGLTIASYNGGFGNVTDAFKPGQIPGASSSDSTASADQGQGDAGAAAGPAGGTAAGVDSGLGGLY